MQQNCWEFKKCGRQPGGEKEAQFGVCPAYGELRADGINGGKNAGRACWAIAGTFCNGQPQGDYACKITTCLNCNFYKVVAREEGEEFKTARQIGEVLKNKSNNEAG